MNRYRYSGPLVSAIADLLASGNRESARSILSGRDVGPAESIGDLRLVIEGGKRLIEYSLCGDNP